MHEFVHTLKHAFMITGFVFVMMLVVEYLNIITSGRWQEKIAQHKWTQYVLAAFLGATPGCLGAFMMVTLYSHRSVTLGALVTAMVATSGDESFVLFAMMPREAFMITVFLAVVGIIAGVITDLIIDKNKGLHQMTCQGMQIHEMHQCDCLPNKEVVSLWKNLTLARAVLIALLLVFLIFTVSGAIGSEKWDWIRVTTVVSISLALFITATVPDHFLEEHLWEHIAKKHAPRIFLWTLGALLAVHVVIDMLNLEPVMKEGRWFILFISALVGIIPESGPHLIFVTMYAKGVIPVSILLTSSIVQDGHGMLPLLACSRRDFILVKGINFLVGLLVGAVFMILGH